jgi:hypothetical protein
MKTIHIVLACIFLMGCGPSPEQLTATAVMAQTQTQQAIQASMSPTPPPNLTATNEANREATRTVLMLSARATLTEEAKPKLAAIIVLDEIKNASKGIKDLDLSEAKLVFGPKSDALVHDSNVDTVKVFDPRLYLKNFIASIKFINPYATSTTGKWDYGILFRNQYGNNQYRFVVFSNQSWRLLNAEKDVNIYSSIDKNLRSKDGEENTIWLVVVDKKAHLFINGIYTKSLDVSSSPAIGDVSPATGIYTGNITQKRSTEFRDFTVWALP